MTDYDVTDDYRLQVIGIVESPFKEKFGTPRQAGLVKEAVGWIRMLSPFDSPDMFDAITGFSHLWLTFIFHQVVNQSTGSQRSWQIKVRPPRLGGNQKVGVFASRSPFRPNHIGLSAVELLGIDREQGVRLQVRGLDLMEGTPILDIKPYLAYADSIPVARSGYASEAPTQQLDVSFSRDAMDALSMQANQQHLVALIQAVLRLDPRPGYRVGDEPDRIYGVRLDELDVRWKVAGRVAEVVEIVVIRSDHPC